MRPVVIAAWLSLVVTAAQAQPTPSAMPAPGANACLDLHRIDGKHADNDRTIIATDLKQRRFKITLLQPCFDIANPFSVISFARVANRSCLSKGDSVVVTGNNRAAGHGECIVQSVQLYTPEMQHADAVVKQQVQGH